MVILYLFDNINGYRYRKISLDYYYRVSHSVSIVSAWIVPVVGANNG